MKNNILHPGNLFVAEDLNTLTEHVIQRIVECANEAIDNRGVFHFALAGGSTPKCVFERLAQPQFNGKLDWDLTHIWFGDERCVAADHADSNYRMASLALLNHVPIPQANIHRIQGELEPQQAAEHFKHEMHQYIGINSQKIPVFDLMLQGLGTDGHTASLFPDSTALDVYDQAATAVYVETMKSWRVSATFPVLNSARCLMFLVAGTGKNEIILDLFNQNTARDKAYPVEMLNPAGKVEWALDKDAAQLIQ
ncbi:MAG: 6-phosphogluconolactonase [Gammaproteobacteria bacterium]|nr:6-phosphogluconolactonase [Gammaproteobacteria bacterium]